MAEIIRPAIWRAPLRAAEVILVAKMPAGMRWRVWHWSSEYELGLDLGPPQISIEEAEDQARGWAAAYKCDWAISPQPIDDNGEMV